MFDKNCYVRNLIENKRDKQIFLLKVLCKKVTKEKNEYALGAFFQNTFSYLYVPILSLLITTK